MNELQGAYGRYGRAGEHLTNLEGVIARIREVCENGVLAEYDAETGGWVPSRHILGPLQLEMGILVAEVAHNLRAALDYLVYVLAEADSGSPQERTQFLIEDHPQGFTGRGKTAFKGVSDEHVAIIRQLQPFKGAQWTAILRDIDNAAKHREVVSVGVDQNVGSILTMSEYTLSGELQFDANGNPIPKGVDMYLKGPVEILLPERRGVMDTLRHLQTQVGLVLQLFTYEFPAG